MLSRETRQHVGERVGAIGERLELSGAAPLEPEDFPGLEHGDPAADGAVVLGILRRPEQLVSAAGPGLDPGLGHQPFLQPLFEEVRVRVYLRRQDELALSFYSQKLRAGFIPPSIMPLANLKRPRQPYFDFDALLSRWAAVFGEAIAE
ncbi:MAG: hypothetical protein P8080_11660, partial [Gammaproteobacteria bacterium]